MRSVCPRLAPHVVLSRQCQFGHNKLPWPPCECVYLLERVLGGINCRCFFLIFLHTCPASYQWFVWVCFYIGTRGCVTATFRDFHPNGWANCCYTLPVSVSHHNPPGCVQLLDEEQRQGNRESEDKALDFLQLLT